MKRIESIKEKLHELKSLDKRFSIFGSSRHKYQLNETLSAGEITKIETDHNILLSEEYKVILQYLGNGGAGCGYGLEKMSLRHIDPPYIGTKKLLRNWHDPKEIETEMVDTDEISGYIKLFDYGCGMEYCLIVQGEEKGALIYFDCDERFEKLEQASLLDMYENWVTNSLSTILRVKEKLVKQTVEEVIQEEWASDNYFIHDMIYSILDVNAPVPKPHTGEYKRLMERMRLAWLS